MSGEGSIFKRTRTSPNGRVYVRWVAQVSSGPRGDRTLIRKTCRTRSLARDALEAMLSTDRSVSKQPLGDYLRSWLTDTAGPSLAPNTARGYGAVIASLASIEDIPLADLTAEDIEGALAGMTAKRHNQVKAAAPASAKTRHNALAMLRRALSVAERRGHLTRNVARMVEMPRVPRQHRDALTPAMGRSILLATAADRYAAAYALALCGLRIGEVLGLAWEDVDLVAGNALVRWQLVGSGKTARRAQLKTHASEAPVPLPGFVVTRLTEHRKAQLAERVAAGMPTEEGLVFTTTAGYGVNASWLTRHFQGLLEAAGLPTLRIHDLRHGAASLLVGAGAHPRIAQSLLRHASSRTTMDVYSHTTKAQEREAADLLEAVLAG